MLAAYLKHLVSIRIGSKSPACWPYRFVTDSDADDLLRLFGEVRDSGWHLALMALRRIQDAGAVVCCQAPLIHHVNDDAATWADLWRTQVRLGAVPYSMFVERDPGQGRGRCAPAHSSTGARLRGR